MTARDPDDQAGEHGMPSMEPDRRLTSHGRREADIAMVTRLDALETRLEALTEQLAGVPEHIAAMCRVAHAIAIVMAPVVWVVGNIRRVVIWAGAAAGAAYAIWMLAKEWQGWAGQ